MTKYLAEGDTVWVKGTVVRGGGSKNGQSVTMVTITDFLNAPPGEEYFTAVFPNKQFKGKWRKV